jgi:integrase
MPSKLLKRGILRYRANVMVQGCTAQKLFPDASKKSHREALVWEKEARKELETKLSQTRTEFLAVGHWTNEYLAEAENRFAKITFQEKKAAFARFFLDTGIQRDFPSAGLTVTICRKYLLNQAKARSGYAANKDRKNLGTAWKWGGENLEGWPKVANPFLSVKKFPEERQPRYVPSEDDFWKVYDQAVGQDQVMLLAYLHLAARRSEVFHLRWSDVDFAGNRVCLWTKKREGGHKEYDWLPMTSELRQVLLQWSKTRLKMTNGDKEHVFVCLEETPFCMPYFGKPFIHRQHLMERLCKKAKVKPFGFHGIRHLTASMLYKKGYPLAVIQAILRHTNPNTTARYIHSLGLEETREALEEGLKGPAQVIDFKKATALCQYK